MHRVVMCNVNVILTQQKSYMGHVCWKAENDFAFTVLDSLSLDSGKVKDMGL